MILEINNKTYQVIIEYKDNKNMYLRIKDDLTIYVTAPLKMSVSKISSFVEENIAYIEKNLKKKEQRKEKLNNKFLYLGNSYDICYIQKKDLLFGNNKVFVGKEFNVNNWYKKKAQTLFLEYYDKCFLNFNKSNLKPFLKIRKMKTKWGVCNIKSKTITLNLDLIKLDPKYLEYVIYHELCHLVHMNHSKAFWNLVEVYVNDYKKIRKEINNIL